MSKVQGPSSDKKYYYTSNGWNFLLKLYQPQLLSRIQGMGFLKTVPKLEGKSILICFGILTKGSWWAHTSKTPLSNIQLYPSINKIWSYLG